MREPARDRSAHDDHLAPVAAHGPVGAQSRVPAVTDAAAPQRAHVVDAAPLIAALGHAGISSLPFPLTDTLTQAQLQELIARLTGGAPSLAAYGPRVALLHILERTGDTTLAALNARLAGLRDLTVMRPDGYMVRAWDGGAIERFAGGNGQPRDGRIMFDQFAAGGIYLNRSNIYYRTNDALAQASGPIGEGGLQHDLPNRVLDGVAGAMGSIVHGFEQLLRHPIRSIEEIRQVPTAVRALIRASPQLWERFLTMPLGDQVQLISRITTELLLLYGSAEGITTEVVRGVRGAVTNVQGFCQVMTVSLSPSGALVRTIQVVRPATVATVIGGAPGAVYVLHMANNASGGGGSGPPAGATGSQPAGASGPGGEPVAPDPAAPNTRQLPPPPEGAAPPPQLAQIIEDMPPGARAVYAADLGDGASRMTVLRAWMRLEGDRLHVRIGMFQGEMNIFEALGHFRALARRVGASSMQIEGDLFQATEANGAATRIQTLVRFLQSRGYRVERAGEWASVVVENL